MVCGGRTRSELKRFARHTRSYGLPVHKVYGWCLKGTENLEKDSLREENNSDFNGV